jgi:hypothetical protein
MTEHFSKNYLIIIYFYRQFSLNIKPLQMKIQNWFRLSLPHIIAVVIFIVVSVAYFYPILEGKILHTNDGTVASNSAREIMDFRAKYGKDPLWTNSMFSGMPAYLISVIYKGNIIRFADIFLRFLKHPAASIFLTMLGFYILLLLLKVDSWLAIAGALAYGFSTYFFFILAAGHNTKAIAIAYMAPMIGSIFYTYRKDAIKGALLTAFFMALEIYANHPQITYYSFICLLIFIITEFIYALRAKELKPFFRSSLVLIFPVLLAVGMNFNSLYTTYEYGKYSTRGKSDLVTGSPTETSGLDKEYITQWSYGIDETFTLFIPNFKGGACQPFSNNSNTVSALRQNNAAKYAKQFVTYWGSQPWVDGPVYVGAIVFFLFILGLLIIKGPEKWWLLAATILSIMLAWGKNFMPLTNLFVDFFPGYNKFRAVTMTLVIAEFCIPLLGFIALRDIFSGKVNKNEMWKGLKIAFAITGGLTLLFVIIPGLAGSFQSQMEKQAANFPAWLSSAIIADRKALLRGDSLRSFFFILLAASALGAWYYEKLKKEYVIGLLALLIMADMWLVDKRYLDADKFVRQEVRTKMLAPSAADNFIMNDKSYYRVLNLSVSPFSDASTSLYHNSIGGYHGAKLKRYQELIDSSLTHDIGLIQTVGGTAKTLDEVNSVFGSTHALNMLNTKYIIYTPELPPLVNNNALGSVWFADRPEFVENANAELSAINKTDLSKIAVIDKQFGSQVRNNPYTVESGDTIYLTSYKANELIYKSKSAGERLAVFSEIYYPAGWKSFIDGKETAYFRADYVLRGIMVPQGEHEIRFSFEPSSFKTGNIVSTTSSAIFILLVAGFIGFQVRNKQKTA